MVKLDRETDQRIVTDKYCGDVEYLSKKGVNAVDNETVVVYGEWTEPIHDGTDNTESGGKKAPMRFPSSNKFQGTEPGLKGMKLGNLNEVGQEDDNTRRTTILKKMDAKDQNY